MENQEYNTQERTRSLAEKPDNNLVWGILCTVLCCLPFGIVSIISATKVDSLWAAGLYEQAIIEAGKAKKWAIWGAILSVVASVIFVIIYILFFVFVGVSSTLPLNIN